MYPYQQTSIHVTRQNKVIVGACNYTEVKGLVIVMDQEGNHDKVYGEDRTKGISLTFPFRITSTNNENICVADIMNNQCGRVVMLGKEDMIYTYSGHPVINTEDKPFTPTGLTTTHADNAIVADAENYALHILNSSSNLITYIST